MLELAVVSLTAAIRGQNVRSDQRPDPGGGGNWIVLADSSTPYTMAQLVSLQSAHSVVASTDRAEFGPGTASQIAGLEAALKTQRIEYRTFEKAVAGEWFLTATSGVMRTVSAVQVLETAHSLVARTTRAEFR